MELVWASPRHCKHVESDPGRPHSGPVAEVLPGGATRFPPPDLPTRGVWLWVLRDPWMTGALDGGCYLIAHILVCVIDNGICCKTVPVFTERPGWGQALVCGGGGELLGASGLFSYEGKF